MGLAGRRVAVTGAAGFVGRALCRALVAEQAQVIGLDLGPGQAERVQATGAEFRAADTADAAATTAALADAELVVHTAARVGDWGPMEEFVRVNVRGTRNVLDAGRAAGAERIVHVSSVAAWGYYFSHDLSEDAAPRPCGTPYVDTKAASDALARARGATVVRPGDVYGPESVPWALRPLRALRERRLFLPRGGGGLITLVYIDDLVDCLLRALTHPAAAGRVYTAWDGRAVRAQEYFDYFARMLGRRRVPNLPLAVLHTAAHAQELAARASGTDPSVTRAAIMFISRRALFPNRRARQELGWAPRVALPEGMAATERWFREQGLL
jgi:nucleoside-diphosphate-sugar epimerase